MSREQLPHELAELLEELCLGDLSPEQAARLEAILQADPEQCRHYVRFVQMHAIAERCEATSPACDHIAPPVVPSPALSKVEGSHRPVLGFLASVSRHVPGGEFTVGSLIVLVIVAAFWGLSQAILFPRLGGHDLAEESSHRPTVPSSDRAETVATIRNESDAQWSSLTPASTRDEVAAFTANQPLSIQSGLIELQLNGGTTLLIEGPADWSIDGDNKATLSRGKLVAKVPQQVIGFTLDTPCAKIVDLGTEFGVEVAEDGQTSAHVFRGSVDVNRAQTNSGKPASSTVRLIAGESARVTPRQGITKTEHRGKAEFVARRITAAQGQAQIAVFQQGAKQPFAEGRYTGCRDTHLIAWAKDFNFGRRTNWDVGNNEGKPAQALLRFDLTPLAGKFSRIVSAKLVLNQDHAIPVLAPGVVDVHLLLAANREWVEGEGQITSLNAEDNVRDGATWLQRQSGSPWLDHLGQAVEGAAYEPSRLASWKYTGGYSNRPIEIPLEGDLSFLAAWADNDDSNAGFLLRGEPFKASNRISFYSADAPIVEARPALVIQYVPRTPVTKAERANE